MKIKSVLILALSASSFTATAQFNTVSHHKALYSVMTVSDSVTAGKEIEKAAPADNSADTASVRKQWIDSYMSVSYPLRKIEITSGYGERRDPFTGRESRHDGLDLRAAQGEEAYAMMSGLVVKVGSGKRSGNYVSMRHGDFTVSYCHLSKTLVKKGQLVSAGEPVGLTGSTGRSTGPHLHLTVRMGRRHINPGVLLQFIDETRRQALEQLTERSL